MKTLAAPAALTLAALLSIVFPASAAPPATRARGLTLERVASGLTDPLYVTAPAEDPRLFVVEQVGRVRIIRGGQQEVLRHDDV